MKQDEDFNLKIFLSRSLICGVLASFTSPAHAAQTLNEMLQTGFSAEMSGKSIASISTMAQAQGFAFTQNISHRQNSLHRFGKSIGQSEVFFGTTPKDNATVGKVIGAVGNFLGVNEITGGAKPRFWSNEFSRKGKVNAAESRETYQYELNGFAGGLDVDFGENWSAGMAGGYSRSSGIFESLYQTDTGVDAYHTALYATYASDDATLDSVVGITYLSSDSDRGLNDTQQLAHAKSKGYQMSWTMSAMGHNHLGGFAVTPLAGFTYTGQVNKGMNEQGAGAYNLSTQDTVRHSLRPMLGFNVAREYTLESGMTLTPEVYGIYRYEMLDNKEDIHARLNGVSNLSLNTPATNLSRHAMQVGGGISFKMSEKLTSKLSFDSDMQPGSHEHRGMFRLNYSW